MKYIIILLALFSVACVQKTTKLRASNPSDIDTSTTTMQINRGTVCYMSLSGTHNQDTAALRLDFNGDNVTGKYYNIPFEKDARIGSVTGRRIADTLKLMWSFNQEGKNQSLPAEFLVLKDKLLQKEYSYDVKTGAEMLSPDSKFTKPYESVDCAKFSVRN